MKTWSISSDNDPEAAWGPYLNRALAETTLKILQMTGDESAELIEGETDPYPQIVDGYKPFKIWATLEPGTQKPTGNHVELCWPPVEPEGLIEQREDYIEYFVWAKSTSEAVLRMGQLYRNKQAELEPIKEGGIEI